MVDRQINEFIKYLESEMSAWINEGMCKSDKMQKYYIEKLDDLVKYRDKFLKIFNFKEDRWNPILALKKIRQSKEVTGRYSGKGCKPPEVT